MAREKNAAATALVAAAALAPTVPLDAEIIEHGDGTATASVDTSEVDWVGRIAELNTELTLERTRTESLRAELADTRARFQAAWDERERAVTELLATVASAPTEAVVHKPVADAQLVLTVRGKRIVLMPGDLIPEGVDLATLPPGSFR